MIDYNKKINTFRSRYPLSDIDISYESDRGRILSAPSLRRLQKKTQVFALELNAAVRTRLTHSIEVAQASRFISKTILKNCNKNENLHNLQQNSTFLFSTKNNWCFISQTYFFISYKYVILGKLIHWRDS